MNYLEKNLHKSKLFPYDIMKIIYEYADPFNKIRKQIENKEYDLDEIMYERMKKYILSTLRVYHNYTVSDENGYVFLNENNIDDRTYYNLILNGNSGYKKWFFNHIKLHNKICGMINNPDYFRWHFIEDLKIVKPDVRYELRSNKQLYPLWKNL